MGLEDRIAPLQRVAVAVIDGHADEPPLEIRLDQAAMHLVKADEVELPASQLPDNVFEKARRYLQDLVGLEPVRARRAPVLHRDHRPPSPPQMPPHCLAPPPDERLS